MTTFVDATAASGIDFESGYQDVDRGDLDIYDTNGWDLEGNFEFDVTRA
jgi:hypothetical protein